MESLRFIHAADLHLDSPFRGLANTHPKLRDELQAATLGAFERIVDHAIQSKADFLRISIFRRRPFTAWLRHSASNGAATLPMTHSSLAP